MIPSGARVRLAAAAQFKALTPIRFDVTSFRRSGADTATVHASTARGEFVVYLVQTDSRWMIAATEPLP